MVGQYPISLSVVKPVIHFLCCYCCSFCFYFVTISRNPSNGKFATWCVHTTVVLTFTTLGANSADDTVGIFLIFPRKKNLTFYANCVVLIRRQCACNIKTCFLGKIRKNILKCRLLKYLLSMHSVKSLFCCFIVLHIADVPGIKISILS